MNVVVKFLPHFFNRFGFILNRGGIEISLSLFIKKKNRLINLKVVRIFKIINIVYHEFVGELNKFFLLLQVQGIFIQAEQLYIGQIFLFDFV